MRAPVTIGLSLAILTTQGLAQNIASDVVSLRGIRVMDVVLVGLDAEAARLARIDTVALRTQTELELRRNGITVVSTASAVLNVNVNLLVISDSSAFAYSIDLEGGTARHSCRASGPRAFLSHYMEARSNRLCRSAGHRSGRY